MRYKLFGTSGLRVSELCLGAMIFGDARAVGATKEESRTIFDAFVEAGGNFIDTANDYANGMSEQLVGEFVQRERERFVLATKYTLTRRGTDPNGGGNHRKNLVHSLEASLKRLKTDYIDLYWLHAWDFLTAVEEIMRALDDQVRAGKILYVGVSDTPAWIVAQANTLAALRGWSPFVGLQVEYSLVERDVERELLPMARAFGMAVTPWSPLGGVYSAANTTPTPLGAVGLRIGRTNARYASRRACSRSRRRSATPRRRLRWPGCDPSRGRSSRSSAADARNSFARIWAVWMCSSPAITCKG
jgi:aryl-alcohol dehydrogenase-like predicted oxidoreductase